jgi:hypothetical protein
VQTPQPPEKPKPSSIPLPDFSGSGPTDRLHQTIREFNERSALQTDTMLRLTRVVAALTFVMLLAVVVQIYLVVYPPK